MKMNEGIKKNQKSPQSQNICIYMISAHHMQYSNMQRYKKNPLPTHTISYTHYLNMLLFYVLNLLLGCVEYLISNEKFQIEKNNERKKERKREAP